MGPVSTLWGEDCDLGKAWWWCSKGPVLRPEVPASGKGPAGSRWGGGVGGASRPQAPSAGSVSAENSLEQRCKSPTPDERRSFS